MNTNKIERTQVIQYIKDLTDKQLTELFYEAVKNRYTFDDEKEWYQSHFVLTTASRMLGDDEQWEDWKLSTVCLHDAEEYPNGWHDESPLVQFGECCGHETSSYAKRAICAVCGAKVYGT